MLLSQFQQAMAIQTAVDVWRSEQPRCMGTLFWQLNDNAVTLVPGQPRTFVFTPYDKATSPQSFKAAFSVTHLADL